MIITKENGYRIVMKEYLPGENPGRCPVVIFSHGFGGNLREIEHHGPGFADAGIACIFFDFCGGGADSQSDGSMNEMTVLTEADDLTAVIKAVRKLDYADPDRIFLAGESMGGFVSAYVASQMPEDIKGLVLWYPAFIIPEDARMRYEAGKTTALGLPIGPDYSKTAMNIDIYNVISRYTNPVKIIHGDEDTIVPLRYSEEALRVYEQASLEVIKGAGHGFNGADSLRAEKLSVEFVKDCAGALSI